MATRATATRQRIVERAALTFNRHGFAATSMAELLQATGLRKGGLYNHFASKEALAVEAFDYAVGLVTARFEAALAPCSSSPDRLRAIVEVMSGLASDPALPGGCPVLRTAVESMEGNDLLRARARTAMSSWQRLVGRTVKDGVRAGELDPAADARHISTVMTATLEGAVMLSLLLDDPKQMRRAATHLHAVIADLEIRATA